MEEIIYVLFLILLSGVCLSAHSLYQLKKEKVIKRDGLKTSAKIIDIEVNSGSDEFILIPIIQFIDFNGMMVRVKSNVGTNNFTKKVGDEVVIFYKPDDPYDVIIELSSLKSQKLFLVLGIILMVIAIFSLLLIS